MKRSEQVSDLLAERQRKYVFFPWTAQSKASPIHIKHADGIELEMFDGKRVLDFTSHIFNANLGHNHPAIKEAAMRGAEQICVSHPSMVHEEKAKLGENLARITPAAPFKGLTKSFFTLGGAEAVENAIKIARLVTGRHKVVTRYRSYHGATLATLGYGGDYRRIPFDGTVTGVVRIPDPYPRGSGQNIDTVRLLEEIIEIEGPETIACVLLEGITGTNGVFVPDASYWPRIRKLCDRYGILLIADEVMSGFGRTGKWFGIDHFGVTPDIMTMAKGLTGGYAPLGAVVVSDDIAKHFDNETLWCGLTAYGHPFCATIANAVIATIESENLIDNAATRGRELSGMLADLKSRHPLVAETRSIGLLAAIDLRKSADDDAPWVPYRAKGDDAAKAQKLSQAFLASGVMVLVRYGTLIIAPPLTTSKEQLAQGMQLIAQVLQEHLH